MNFFWSGLHTNHQIVSIFDEKELVPQIYSQESEFPLELLVGHYGKSPLALQIPQKLAEIKEGEKNHVDILYSPPD
jgi:hypothetical protein